VTAYEEHQACADVIEESCVARYGTEYEGWPPQYFQDYAEHLMLGLDAMTEEEMSRRFRAEPDARFARDQSCDYWATIVMTRDR
jgi:hypothetical protein